MPRRFASVLKLALLMTTVILTGVGILWVSDVFTAETAKDYALKALLIMAVFTVGMLVVASLGGGPSGSGGGTGPTGGSGSGAPPRQD
jgi:hypothetical protein